MKLDAVPCGAPRLLVKARVVDRYGRPSREVDGEREIRVTEAAARLRRQERQRSERPPASAKRKAHPRADPEGVELDRERVRAVHVSRDHRRRGVPREERLARPDHAWHACRRVEIELVVPKLSEHVGVQASRVLDGEPLIEPSGAAV